MATLGAIHSAGRVIPTASAIPYRVAHNRRNPVDVLPCVNLALTGQVKHDLAELTAGAFVLVAEPCRPCVLVADLQYRFGNIAFLIIIKDKDYNDRILIFW